MKRSAEKDSSGTNIIVDGSLSGNSNLQFLNISDQQYTVYTFGLYMLQTDDCKDLVKVVLC